jgi:hypothetical protein
MFKSLETFGYRMVNRLLPQVTASAKVCGCDPGSSWCRNRATNDYCRCGGDCVTVTCSCNPAGCR